MFRGSVNLAQASLNVLPGFSSFTLVFICIFPGWSMGVCGFCLSDSGLLGDQFFTLSLTVLGGWIGEWCKSYFVRGYLCLSSRVLECFSLGYPIGFLFTCDFLSLSLYWMKCLFLGDSETVSNHLVSIGSVSLSELYILYLDWVDPPSVQRRLQCFLPCRTLRFSLLPGRPYFSCALLWLFLFLFYRRHKILSKPGWLVSSLDI